jgi:hypothetical protein
LAADNQIHFLKGPLFRRRIVAWPFFNIAIFPIALMLVAVNALKRWLCIPKATLLYIFVAGVSYFL